ncbi:hypothetical protein [Microbacterium album]|uniref:Uncharacterized protein n=1 Tax=Microbacterium album TaxID=2053191 RepID=A0A917IGA6_9MICO|nr:hypothetical protein [Microbacterium album]GGH43430.1 hypothetical protein GCM10010921_17330 [Microbacterium album]
MDTAPVPRWRRLWPGLALTAVLLVTLAAIWFGAVPRDVACRADYPGDPTCTPEQRRAVALGATIGVTVLYAALLAAIVTLGRRYPVAVAIVATAVLGLAGVIAYQITLASTGYVGG